jgi:hypothetical protein
MKTTFSLLASLCAGACLLSSCGGGGGGGSTGAAGGPVTTPLGSVELPDGTVTVTATTEMKAGKSASFLITLPTITAVTGVEALVGTSYEDPALISVTAQSGINGWVASMVLPDPIPPSCRVLVRVTTTDGGVQESGYQNFAINP